MKKRLLLILCYLVISFSSGALQTWGLGPFVKPGENPIAGPDSTFLFFCPERKQMVQWQKADVFNPAAIVPEGKGWSFSEKSGTLYYGTAHSFIGLAISENSE